MMLRVALAFGLAFSVCQQVFADEAPYRRPLHYRHGWYLPRGTPCHRTPAKAGAAAFETLAPRALFSVHLGRITWQYPYDVASHGHRFLVLAAAADAKSQPMTVVINWQQGLGSGNPTEAVGGPRTRHRDGLP